MDGCTLHLCVILCIIHANVFSIVSEFYTDLMFLRRNKHKKTQSEDQEKKLRMKVKICYNARLVSSTLKLFHMSNPPPPKKKREEKRVSYLNPSLLKSGVMWFLARKKHCYPFKANLKVFNFGFIMTLFKFQALSQCFL